MICRKCGSVIPDGRKVCLNCGTSSEVDPLRGQGGTSGRPKSFIETKTGVILFGVIEVFIGLFASFYAALSLSDISASVGLAIGGVIGLITVGLPIVGLILIGIGKNKIGGAVLIAGSVLCIPIGLIGITGGINAWKLEGPSS